MDIQFPLARVDDIDLLTDFMKQFYAIDHYPFDEQAARKSLKDFLKEPLFGRAWLIKRGEEAIGYIAVTFGYSLEFHGRDAFIDEFFLLEAYRHQGIGTRTLQFVFEQCQYEGIHAIHLEVEYTNTTGQALYSKMGFDLHEQRLLMTKWLEQ